MECLSEERQTLGDMDSYILWATLKHMGAQPKQASWMVQKILNAYMYFIEAGLQENDVLNL